MVEKGRLVRRSVFSPRSVVQIFACCSADNAAGAQRVANVEIATIPEHIRGYGHIKEAHLAKARARWDELIAMWRTPPAARAAA